MIVGAYKYNSFTGRAYIYYGSTSGIPTTPNVTLDGENTNDQFGYSVSSAGDVNNDGYDDVIVGAYKYNNFTGRAYIYYGSSNGIPTTPNVTLDGENLLDRFGYAVSSAGDVNNDGYDDVIVGAEGYNNFTGRAYIYYGDSSMNSIADITFDAETQYSEFAGYETPLSYGDINGDCATDIIIGAPGADNGDYDGAVYIYYGTGGVCPTPTPSSSNTNTHQSDTGGSTSEQSIDSITQPTLNHSTKKHALTVKLATSLVVPIQNTDSLLSLYLHIGKKKYFFKHSTTNPTTYTLKLPKTFKPGIYKYTLTANYGFTTSSTKGLMTVKR